MGLLGLTRSTQQRKSQTRSKMKARREQKLKAEDESALQKMGEMSLNCFTFCLCSWPAKFSLLVPSK